MTRSSEILKGASSLIGARILFCGRGQNQFPALRGTNSELIISQIPQMCRCIAKANNDPFVEILTPRTAQTPYYYSK